MTKKQTPFACLLMSLRLALHFTPNPTKIKVMPAVIFAPDSLPGGRRRAFLTNQNKFPFQAQMTARKTVF